MAKEIIYEDAARRAIEKGIDAVANSVKLTLGPRGRNVMLDGKFGMGPQIINDGVTIAKEIDLANKMENTGAQLVKQCCMRTNESAGDGTTTAAVLLQAIIKGGLKNVAAGTNPVLLRSGIEKGAAAAVEVLKRKARIPSTALEIAQIATISAGNNQEFGQLVADAVSKVGRDGVVQIDQSKTGETHLEIMEGMQFDRGFIHQQFINSQGGKFECVLENPFIAFVDKSITLNEDLMPLLEQIAGPKGNRTVLIVADDVSGEALASLIVNKQAGKLFCCAVKMPGYGESAFALLQDMAVLTGGKVISREAGEKISSVEIEDLGRAQRVIVKRDRTMIVGGAGSRESIDERVEQMRKEAEELADNKNDQEWVKERIARLTTGVAVIRVGGATDIEVNDKKLRFEDALNATRAAIEEGYVAGGGTCLVEVATEMQSKISERTDLNEDEVVGYRLVIEALREPLRQIAKNAGLEPGVILAEVTDRSVQTPGIGYDALNQQYVDMISAGILDPVKVERCAVQNAASVAGLFLTTEALVVEVEKDEPVQQPARRRQG